MHLPEKWGNDKPHRKKAHVPVHIEFLTKSQIALQLPDQSTEDGISVKAWTFDEIYPRFSKRDRVGKEVRNLRTYSPGFRDQAPQRYRVRDARKGPELWDIQWHACHRRKVALSS